MTMREWTLIEWQTEVGRWRDATFPASTPASTLTHLARELEELVSETDPEKRRVECADIVLLLMGLAHVEGWSLMHELRRKFTIVQARTWGEPDAEGVVEHVRGKDV